MANKILLSILAVSLLCNGIIWYMYDHHSRTVAAFESTALQKQYPFISEQILEELPQDTLINFYDLRAELRKTVEPYGEDFGVYFEYLPTGTSVGINSNDEFYAASLFKVPVVMAYYHQMDREHRNDDPVIEVKKEHLDNEFGTLWEKGAGTKLKSSEAIRLSLVESDNTAIKALLPHITQQDFTAVYNGLDIDLRADKDGALVSTRTYASILKALYYSSVIPKESSQKILEMLTKTKFNDKLAAGVPGNVPVAHKIGDFKSGEAGEGYRDCGIVYQPRRAYVLCMFSVGNEDVARERMKIVSKKVYDYVAAAQLH